MVLLSRLLFRVKSVGAAPKKKKKKNLNVTLFMDTCNWKDQVFKFGCYLNVTLFMDTCNWKDQVFKFGCYRMARENL